MEIKSNVRQRRMDRMKQLTERQGGTPPAGLVIPDGYRRDRLPEPAPLQVVSKDRLPQAPELHEPGDERWLDPEFVWKQRDRFRAERTPLWANPSASGPSHYETGPRSWNWRHAFGGRRLWVKAAVAAVLFGLSAASFRLDHPLALQGRQWVTTALTVDYDFEAARAWYASRFSGLPAVLPASWHRPDPEAQKAAAVNARQLVAPILGKIAVPYTVTDPMMAIEPAANAGDAVAIDAGRILSVAIGTDGHVQVVIQHADGMQSTYGGLAQTALKRFDWIKAGEPVGPVAAASGGKGGRLLFAIKKDSAWVDPTDVVSFD